MFHKLWQTIQGLLPHAHKAAKHGSTLSNVAHKITKNLPTASQIGSAIGGVNASLNIIDRIRKAVNGSSSSEPDEKLWDDFLVHIQELDTKIQTLETDNRNLSQSITVLNKELLEQKNTNLELSNKINEVDAKRVSVENDFIIYKRKSRNQFAFMIIGMIVLVSLIGYLYWKIFYANAL